jgi:zinc protease
LLKPKFVDYKKEILLTKMNNGIDVSYINNSFNELCDMNIIFDMGSDNDKK